MHISDTPWPTRVRDPITHIAEQIVATAVAELRAYSEAGGEILFGTDVGYLTDYNPAAEYALMQRAGVSFGKILASLATAPASRYQ